MLDTDQHILQTLARMEATQQMILEKIETLSATMVSGEVKSRWLDGQEVMNFLRISVRTLYRLRKNGSLISIRKGGRHYYHEPDIMKLRIQFLK